MSMPTSSAPGPLTMQVPTAMLPVPAAEPTAELRVEPAAEPASEPAAA